MKQKIFKFIGILTGSRRRRWRKVCAIHDLRFLNSKVKEAQAAYNAGAQWEEKKTALIDFDYWSFRRRMFSSGDKSFAWGETPR